ncbi:MAG: ABC transporter permease [Deltaproteobacteria bacterium]|jgi:NitT/TauT family transport system permease protein|nr:ABC transporter permease [Deltaproteobacteria bacterium]
MKIGPAFTALAVFVLGWHLAAWLAGPQILPSPWAVGLDLAGRLQEAQFYRHFLASFRRASAGIFLGLLLAVPLGWLMGSFPKLDSYLAPLLFLTYPVPKILFLPVLLVMLGLGEAPKIVLAAVTAGYQVLVVVRDCIISLDRSYFETFSLLLPENISPLKKAASLIRHVLLPASLPAAATAVRLASGTAVAVLFMAESFATDLGLGFLIVDAWGNLDLPRMFSGILAMGFLGGFYYVLANLAEKKLCPWSERYQDPAGSRAGRRLRSEQRRSLKKLKQTSRLLRKIFPK